MTPEEIEERRGYLWRESLEYEPYGLPTPTVIRYGLDFVREVDRLRGELIEARLSAQEAWDAYDEKEETP